MCQPNNHEIALMGELSAQTLQARGVLGYVVDGGSRDTDLVLEQGFPVFCCVPDADGHRRAMGSRSLWRARDDRRRHDPTGDFLLGDRDGVVIIPRDAAAEAIARTEAVMATESEMRTALIGGMDPVEAYNRFGKF